MRVLVTGGAGYIGSHAVRLLRERGHAPLVLDTLEAGHRAAIGDAELVVGSVADEALLDRLFAAGAIDAVLHFAAYKAAGESMTQPDRYFENIVSGSLTLLRAMQRAGVRRLVFSSTAGVYGTPERSPVDETAALAPENPYAESKRIVEQMLWWFGRCRGLRFMSLRYFNAAGAALDGAIGEATLTPTNLIPIVMRTALGRQPRLQVFGTDYPTPDGTAIRDYIHVLDLVDAHLLALEYLAADGESAVLNLGTGRGASVREVIDVARRITGRPIAVEEVGRRPGDPAAVWADAGAARRRLGWEPKYGLDDIIRTAWAWHSTHPNGYDDGDD
jgi:UDP-glucose 4-epimerase